MRIPLLLETLRRYRTDAAAEVLDASPDDPIAIIRSGRGLNDFIIAAYRLASSREGKHLSMVPNESQSFEILCTAYHYCGHGEDVAPPLDFALRHFRHRLYSHEFFDALRVYRECLAHTRHTATQRIKATIDLILWQDLRTPNDACWSATIRFGLRGLEDPVLAQWKWLFHGFCYSTVPAPPKRWQVTRALHEIGRDRCSATLVAWLGAPPMGRPIMTSTGSVVFKNLAWLASLLECDEFDGTLHEILFLPWKKTQPLDKIAIALAWRWSQYSDRRVALRRIGEIVEKFGDGGDQIAQIQRRVLTASS